MVLVSKLGAQSGEAPPAKESAVLPEPSPGSGNSPGAGSREPGTHAQPTAEQIAQWIRDLDSPRLRVREQATLALIEAGRAALDQVADAARTAKGEEALRTVRVLASWAGNGDEELAAGARQVLRELSRSDDPDLARRAAEALSQVPDAPNDGLPPVRPLPGGALRNLRVSQRTDAQGRRTTEIDADGTLVTIQESPQDGIKLTIRAAGQAEGEAQTFEAKDAADLKQRHPEAYRWYRYFVELRQQRAGRGFGRGWFGIFPPGLFPPGLGRDTQQALEEIKAAQQSLNEVTEALLAAATNGQTSAERLKELAAELRSAQNRLEAAEEALENAQPFLMPPFPPVPAPFGPPNLPLPFDPPALPLPIDPPPAPDPT